METRQNQESINALDTCQFEIINPRETLWCSLETAQEVIRWIIVESQGSLANMLPQEPENLLAQMEKGRTLIVVHQEQVIGHVTLWEYETPGWGELGSLIIHPLFRNQGIGEALCLAFSEAFPLPFQIVATTKTCPAQHVIRFAGFQMSSFDELQTMSKTAWRECCPCYSPSENCPKRDKKCRLLIRK